MSRLYANEQGRVIPTLCEELTRFRYARTRISLPTIDTHATLYILARPYDRHSHPLHVQLNNKRIADLSPGDHSFYRWHEIPLSPGFLKRDANCIQLWTASTAMDAWSLALEPGVSDTHSEISDDEGKTWRNIHMGYLNAVTAEYVVRIRGGDESDPPPPAVTYESKNHPKLTSLRNIIPAYIRNTSDSLAKVQALSTWISMSWEHTGSGRASVYTPWDAETILSWGGSRTGHNGDRPIVMCVHYAAAFVSACQALDIPARCIVLMGTPNGTNGHFVSEVWIDGLEKWVLVDPNADAMFILDGVPLSALEVQDAGDDLSEIVSWGDGSVFQQTFSHIKEFVRDNLLKGICFRHISIWPHANLLSRPDLSPPGHGSVSYCETDLVWMCKDEISGFGMFKYFADRTYFSEPPGRMQ